MTRYLTRKTERQPPHYVVRDLRDERERKRITRLMLAARIGCDHETIGRRENGSVSPSLKELEEWADALDLEIEIRLRPKRRFSVGYDQFGPAFPVEPEP